MRRLLLFLPIMIFAVMLNTSNFSCYMASKKAEPTETNIIDVHAHIGEFRGYDLSLETLLKEIKENKIQYAFISNIDGAAISGVTADSDEVTANEVSFQAAKANPKLKPLFWAKPGAKMSSAEAAEKFLRDKNFCGIKFHPDFNNFSANAPEIMPYLALCEKYKVPALFHCGGSRNSNASVIYEAAKKFPTVPFVLYHMGFNTSHQEAIAVAEQAKNKKDALIYLETSHVSPETVLRAIKTVGADRVVFGTDATYYGEGHYQQYLDTLQTIKKNVSSEEFQQFIHNNAVSIFNLTEAKTNQGNKNEPARSKNNTSTKTN